MTTITHTGAIAFVPVLQEASQISLAVVAVSQEIRRNKAAFNRLANDVSEFVDNMIRFYQMMEQHFPQDVPQDLAVVFQSSVNTLNSIRNFMRHVASRNFFLALIFSRADMREIKSLDMTLETNKGSFKLISNAYIKRFVTELSAETPEALLQ